MLGQMEIQDDDAGIGFQADGTLQTDEIDGLFAVPEDVENIGVVVLVEGVSQKKDVSRVVFHHYNPGRTLLFHG